MIKRYTEQDAIAAAVKLYNYCQEREDDETDCERCPFYHGLNSDGAPDCEVFAPSHFWEISHKYFEAKKPVKRAPFDLSLREDRNALRGRWISARLSSMELKEARIIGFECFHYDTPSEFWSVCLENVDRLASAEDLFERCTFADGPDAGLPVGKEVEDE